MLCTHNLGPFPAEDSEDEKEDHKNVRQQRQAASKAASKQREMLMDDVGSEEEEQEDDEAQFQESEYMGWQKGAAKGTQFAFWLGHRGWKLCSSVSSFFAVYQSKMGFHN